MAITTLAGYNAARKQVIDLFYPANITTAAGSYGSGWLIAGTNTANGIVPTQSHVATSTWGMLDTQLMNAPAGQSMYLTKAKAIIARGSATSFPGSRVRLHDMLFKAGAYSFNSNVTLSSQPSYSSRIPYGTDYSATEIWFECVTAFTGNPTITVTYTNQDGVTGRTTSISPTAPIVRQLGKFSLQAGDTGVQKIESVVATVATAGTFNILVLRRLAMYYGGGGDQAISIGSSCKPNIQGILHLGMPQIFDNSCFYITASGTSTSSGTFGWEIEVASG